MTSGDRSTIIYNHCSPIVNQLSNAVVTQSSYVYVTITTKTPNYVYATLSYYFLNVVTSATTTTTIATPSTFPTLSTAGTTTKSPTTSNYIFL